MDTLDTFVFEHVDNDLNYKQYMQLHEVYETLKHFGKPSFKNKMLIAALSNHTQFAQQFEEHHCA
jgi:hypothetical protein